MSPRYLPPAGIPKGPSTIELVMAVRPYAAPAGCAASTPAGMLVDDPAVRRDRGDPWGLAVDAAAELYGGV